MSTRSAMITYELLAGQPLIDARKNTVAQIARMIQEEERDTQLLQSRLPW